MLVGLNTESRRLYNILRARWDATVWNRIWSPGVDTFVDADLQLNVAFDCIGMDLSQLFLTPGYDLSENLPRFLPSLFLHVQSA